MSVSPTKLTDGIGAEKAPVTAGAAFFRFAEERRSFWVLLSLAILFGAWEIAGLIPISFAFPTFSETVMAFFEMVFDGTMIEPPCFWSR